jgi:hypothetical protein
MRIYHHFLEARDLTRVVEDRRDSAIDFGPAVLAIAEDPWRAHSTLWQPRIRPQREPRASTMFLAVIPGGSWQGAPDEQLQVPLEAQPWLVRGSTGHL